MSLGRRERVFLEEKATRLRRHSLRATTTAGSGHPTSCLSAADIAAVLFFSVMRYDPSNPRGRTNDRFVLSKGHAAPLLYAAWAEAGALPESDLETLRRFDSPLEGHPTPRFAGAEVATGSLGQGLSVGIGMAIAGLRLDDLSYRVYVLLGDGETAEGAVWEAAALGAHYRLDNLVAVVDVNGLGQSQETMCRFDTEGYVQRFRAFGWEAFDIDGHSIDEIARAFERAAQVSGRPVAIIARTRKGQGVSFVAGKQGWHGKPVPAEDLDRALAELPLSEGTDGWSPSLPPAVPAPSPSPTAEMTPPGYKLGDMVATREAYGTALAKLGTVEPRLVVLDGDTKNSTYAERFLAAHPKRYIESFIAEQNMVGMAVGLATCGKIPFVSTFAAFLCRAFDHIRMAAVSRARMTLAGSHCGVSIGEDGPSQMGLEDLAMMRAIPGSQVLYPADAVSAERLVAAAARSTGISYIRLGRPKTPVVYGPEEEFPIPGCKVLRQSPGDRALVVAAGVTLYEALRAQEELARAGIAVRVIDAYAVKPLDARGIAAAARAAGGVVVTVEDHYPQGGLGDAVLEALGPAGIPVHKLAVSDIPRSGKSEELLAAYGIAAQSIAERVRALIGR